MTKKLVLLGLLFLVAPARGGEITVTIPDAKDAKVIAAKDHYNSRTGQSLTNLQYVTLLLKNGVVAELVLMRETEAQQTKTGARQTFDSTVASEDQAVQNTLTSESANW